MPPQYLEVIYCDGDWIASMSLPAFARLGILTHYFSTMLRYQIAHLNQEVLPLLNNDLILTWNLVSLLFTILCFAKFDLQLSFLPRIPTSITFRFELWDEAANPLPLTLMAYSFTKYWQIDFILSIS